MIKSTCTIEECERGVRCKGLCGLHYGRLLKTGTTDAPPSPTLEQRFWAKVSKTGGCWEWTGCKTSSGYGQFKAEHVAEKAHRVAWKLINGPIPSGNHIDHLCHTPACVRPTHLRLATNKQNGENRKGPAGKATHSGVRGVHKSGERWVARVCHNGKQIGFGSYATINEAEAAAIDGRRNLFTHSQN